ncbi:BTAD domain-containing putative transcriptional regulator [Sporichthya sp.]|uniref:BTAD domain-containing putative transcriptional regulator n=1 Tax=Sporichthya sp. TaxID=65475 RepID=UPI001828330D|nr:BTAD domain-containing putative transcriptional regulator [Sporichthya sp.]MBA3744493.1 LysM peptidoglycan-binding domain-containing protein [Sporichthya sp.]
MSSQPRPTTAERSPAHRAAIASGLAAAGLLFLLVVAPPTALLVAVGNPMPEQAAINGRLTDSAVIGMLAAVVWMAWAQLMLAVVVEAIAAVRRAPLPRGIPFTGPQQHLARRLVVAVSFLLVSGAALNLPAAAASPASAAAVSCLPTSADVGRVTPKTAASTVPASALKPAEREISPRPPAIPAQMRAALPTATSTDQDGHWYTVRPPRGAHHDTLWGIAERHLGDGLRWKEIYELNRGRSQPDGRHLTTPSLIHPGWRLKLPADAVGVDRPGAPASAAVEVERTHRVATDKADRAPSQPLATEQAPGAPATAGVGTSATPSAPDVGSGTAAVAPPAANDDDGVGVPIGALTLGLSGLACTGLIAELARRRRRAQRFRRPGERLRRPAPATERLERELHLANAELTVATLRGALHRLSEHCHRTSRALPDLQLIELAPTGATLHFADDEPDAPPPFVAAGTRTWTLAPDLEPDRSDPVVNVRAAEVIEDPVDPYPALVAAGVAGGSMVLVNLEAVGTLRISGPPEEAERILCAIALELGTSDLCRSTELTAAGCPPELLRVLDRGRVRATDSATGHRWVENRQRDVGVLLDGVDAPSMLDARARQVVADAWAPAILIESVSPTDTSLACAVAPAPHRGTCLITTRPAEPAATVGWTLAADNGVWRLDPPNITIEPQQLEPGRLAQLYELVTVDVEEAPALAPTDADTVAATSVGPHKAPRCADLVTVVERPSGPTSLDLGTDEIAVFRPGDADRDAERADGPRVLVLGPVEITGAGDDAQPGRRRRATELIAYLALHPGASQHQLDEALWPGVRVARGTRNPLVSRARQWLGLTPDGQPYVAMIGEGQEYRLHPEATCDWDDFRSLAAHGLAAGANGLDELEAALSLVRGRPFLGVNPAAYGWAEAETQDMISAIVDVAHALAEQALAAGDHRRARWATAKGITAEPCAELLYRDAICAAKAGGDRVDAERLGKALRDQVDGMDPTDDIDDDTALVLRGLVDPGASRYPSAAR